MSTRYSGILEICQFLPIIHLGRQPDSCIANLHDTDHKWSATNKLIFANSINEVGDRNMIVVKTVVRNPKRDFLPSGLS